MEWLSSLIGVGTSVASGGLFGLIGSLAGVGMKMWQKKQDRGWEKENYSPGLRKPHGIRSGLECVHFQGIWKYLADVV